MCNLFAVPEAAHHGDGEDHKDVVHFRDVDLALHRVGRVHHAHLGEAAQGHALVDDGEGPADHGLARHNGGQRGDDEHGPEDGARHGLVEGGVEILGVVPQVGGLADVGDGQARVADHKEAHLRERGGLSVNLDGGV